MDWICFPGPTSKNSVIPAEIIPRTHGSQSTGIVMPFARVDTMYWTSAPLGIIFPEAFIKMLVLGGFIDGSYSLSFFSNFGLKGSMSFVQEAPEVFRTLLWIAPLES